MTTLITAEMLHDAADKVRFMENESAYGIEDGALTEFVEGSEFHGAQIDVVSLVFGICIGVQASLNNINQEGT
jgi:flagellar biosynthesis component FlhA